MAGVPALVPVTDPTAAASLAPEAPAVPAGKFPVHADWVAAGEDYQRRASLSRQLPPRVTEVEVAAALRRAQDIYASMQPAAGQQQVLRQLRLIRRRLSTMEARLTNHDARQHNRVQRAARYGQAQPLSPLAKERRLLGPPLPGMPPSVQVLAPVRTLCPNFPATIAAVAALTNAQLSRLAQWYNNHFGIVAGDSLAVRRAKFTDFIT